MDRYGFVTCMRSGSPSALRKYGRRSQFAPCASTSGRKRDPRAARHCVRPACRWHRVKSSAPHCRAGGSSSTLLPAVRPPPAVSPPARTRGYTAKPRRHAPLARFRLQAIPLRQFTDHRLRMHAIRQSRMRPRKEKALHEVRAARQRKLRFMLRLDAFDQHELARLMQQRHDARQHRFHVLPLLDRARAASLRNRLRASAIVARMRSIARRDPIPVPWRSSSAQLAKDAACAPPRGCCLVRRSSEKRAIGGFSLV